MRQKRRERFWRRLTIFHGRISRISGDDPSVHAATYPDIVALARLLASAYWMSVAVSGRLRCQQLFAEEMRRTIAPRYEWPQPPGSWDPLFRYLRDLPRPEPAPGHSWPRDIFGATPAYIVEMQEQEKKLWRELGKPLLQALWPTGTGTGCLSPPGFTAR